MITYEEWYKNAKSGDAEYKNVHILYAARGVYHQIVAPTSDCIYATDAMLKSFIGFRTFGYDEHIFYPAKDCFFSEDETEKELSKRNQKVRKAK